MAKKTKIKKKKPLTPSQHRAKIWKKFCDLGLLDKYYLVYDNCGLYDDFRARLEEAGQDNAMGEDGESLKDLEKEINSLKKK